MKVIKCRMGNADDGKSNLRVGDSNGVQCMNEYDDGIVVITDDAQVDGVV